MTTSLMAVAIDHHHGFNKPFVQTKRCNLRSCTHLDFARLELDSIHTTNTFHRSSSTPCLSSTTKLHRNNDPNINLRVDIVAGRGAPGIRALVVEASLAMASGFDLVPASGGLGSAYYLRSRTGQSISVIKPIMEDPIYGSRIFPQPNLTGVREVAAYLLDHNNFAGVPPTALIKISYGGPQTPKMASIQRFIPHDFDAGDLGPSAFSVASVHHIGILDVRLLNIDRHAGNILVKKTNPGSYDGYVIGPSELVPIDHGLCLPESLDPPYFEWLHWPQAFVPFSDSETEYINGLDPFKDAELLRTELPLLRESCIRILVVCTIFLKRAISAGLCLADIGDMMTRECAEEEPSMLETLCMQANGNVDRAFESDSKGEGEVDDGFQFDMDCSEEEQVINVLDVPQFLQSHHQVIETRPRNLPLKIPSVRLMSDYPHAILSPLHEEDDDRKVGYLPKSVSFSVMGHNHECSDISFRDMSEDEWEIFLERFEELLEEAFESRKSLGLKQKLGTSCKF